ncbi:MULTISPECIES: hypothetical protein [Sorangium]|uniref:hypothetical protein n=1 Tax=Sorangium TaxID=39643 RepID=UPI003D9C5D9D
MTVSDARAPHRQAPPLAEPGRSRGWGRAWREALPPVVRLEAALHRRVAYGTMPPFALASAAVS